MPTPILTGASRLMPSVANTASVLDSSSNPPVVPLVPTATSAPANTTQDLALPAVCSATGSLQLSGGGLNTFVNIQSSAQDVNMPTTTNRSVLHQFQPLPTSVANTSTSIAPFGDLVQPQPTRPVPKSRGLSLSKSPTVQPALVLPPLQPQLVQPTLPQFAVFGQLPQQGLQAPSSRLPSLQASSSQAPTPSSHTRDHKPEFKIIDVVCKSALQ